jgi:tRNA (guanine-N7-)-methyltransferase
MSFSLTHRKPIDTGTIGIAPDQLPPTDSGPIDLKNWFSPNHDRPIELEIGSGKGSFLVRQAALTPLVNYIGIEYAKPFYRYAADRCRRHDLNNVRLVNTEAHTFLQLYTPDASFHHIHIYFPDPWPKTRHHKRRIIQEPFLRQAHRALETGGLVSIATDHADYFQWMIEHTDPLTAIFERLPFARPDSAEPGELVGTNFELKYRREGRPFHGMTLRKIDV